jgi:hypothetical protein
VDVANGSSHGCGLLADGSATCWGLNDRHQTEARPGTYTKIVAGTEQTCALDAQGFLTCWGALVTMP